MTSEEKNNDQSEDTSGTGWETAVSREGARLADDAPLGNDTPLANDAALLIDIEGFEGPLDLLLNLARAQKVDLARISILALTEQYLVFIAEARALNLEVAADYLVMAAWLAYLKSRLLLPEDDTDDEPSGEELAAHLAFRLKRLEAMRERAGVLMARNRLGRDVFARGAPEAVITRSRVTYTDNLYDLLDAYAKRRQQGAVRHIEFKPRPVMAVTDAKKDLENLLGEMSDWMAFDQALDRFPEHIGGRRSAMASGLTAALELAREGRLELRQGRVFDPVYLKARAQQSA